MSSRHISVVWDFDKTLTPKDSTTEIIRDLTGDSAEEFWDSVHQFHRDGRSESPRNIERLLASDAPTWMFVLARIAFISDVVLDSPYFFSKVNLVPLFPGVKEFLQRIKALGERPDFTKLNITVHHFIVSAGLVDFIEHLLPTPLIDCHWGCKYLPLSNPEIPGSVESIPVFCMDETMKTRALFEIAKGVWNEQVEQVNDRVAPTDMWCPFENIIYVGDGPTDIPALSLVRDRGGYGIVVHNPEHSVVDLQDRLKTMAPDERCDCIVPADYSHQSDLEKRIVNQCDRILQRYQARDFLLYEN